jgi:hypothetical protein
MYEKFGRTWEKMITRYAKELSWNLLQRAGENCRPHKYEAKVLLKP